jgi:hypothetical protein
VSAADAGLHRPTSQPFLWVSIVLGALLSLAACYAVGSQTLVIGSLEGGWRYGYGAPFSMRLLIVFACATAIACAPLFASAAGGRRTWSLLLVWILIATALHGWIRSLGSFTLEEIFVSDGANAFYTVAQRHDPGEILRRFDWVRERAPLHAQSNLPGKVMLVHALQTISTRSDVLPWLLVAISNLGALLMYAFVRGLFDDRRTALFAAVLYLFMPARIFFMPLMNTITPVLILGCGCLLLVWLRTTRTVYAVLLGMALYALVFFEPLPLVMGVLFAAVSIRAIALRQIAWDRFAAQTVLMVLVFIATAEVVDAATGFALFTAFRDIGAHAVAFNESAGRPYRVWIAANLREFVFGTGICQVTAFAGALADGVRGPGSWADRLTRPVTVACLSLLAVLAAIDLIGVNRGEVSRLWIFLGCFWQIPAAYVCRALEDRRAMAIVLASSLLQAVLGAAMIHFVVP